MKNVSKTHQKFVKTRLPNPQECYFNNAQKKWCNNFANAVAYAKSGDNKSLCVRTMMD